jgi:hypothetical protein
VIVNSKACFTSTDVSVLNVEGIRVVIILIPNQSRLVKISLIVR